MTRADKVIICVLGALNDLADIGRADEHFRQYRLSNEAKVVYERLVKSGYIETITQEETRQAINQLKKEIDLIVLFEDAEQGKYFH